MNIILNSIGVLGGLGLLFGGGLSIASKAFHVETDPKIDEISNALAGANCGACGYPGCQALAVAIADGRVSTSSCPVGGASVAGRISEIMGTEDVSQDKMVASVLCQGDRDLAKDKYTYAGISDCRAQNALAGGCKSCNYGCLGCGTCVDVCMFDAIHLVNGIAIVDEEKCTACELCIKECPKNIIELVPYGQEVVVKCFSQDPGKVVRNNCSVGCIGCKICVKNCPEDAFAFENNLAKINYEKCTNCYICVEKCPTKAISPGLVKEKLAI